MVLLAHNSCHKHMPSAAQDSASLPRQWYRPATSPSSGLRVPWHAIITNQCAQLLDAEWFLLCLARPMGRGAQWLPVTLRQPLQSASLLLSPCARSWGLWGRPRHACPCTHTTSIINITSSSSRGSSWSREHGPQNPKLWVPLAMDRQRNVMTIKTLRP